MFEKALKSVLREGMLKGKGSDPSESCVIFCGCRIRTSRGMNYVWYTEKYLALHRLWIATIRCDLSEMRD